MAKKKTPSGPLNSQETVWVWHPAVHERFQETLFYFLLQVRPFELVEFDNEVKALMSKYGVPRYCLYQLFGNVDCLLRVWLPPQAGRQFKEDALGLRNVKLVNDLYVAIRDKRLCWIFNEAEKLPINSIAEAAARLTEDEVRRQQVGDDESLRQRLKDTGLIFKRPVETVSGVRIKAFIAFSQPDSGTNEKLRQAIVDRLVEMLKDREYRFDQPPTLMIGVGFCWAFVKVVAQDYAALGRFVNKTNSEFGLYGIYSSTLLVVGDPPPIEGDSVSASALGVSGGFNPLVARVLAGLYGAPLDHAECGKFEDFVLKRLPSLESQPTADSVKDMEVMRNFLEASVRDDRDAAFLALYPAIKGAERRLREPLGRLVGKTQYPGGMPALLEFLKQNKINPPKSPNDFTLRDSLQAGAEILRHALPDDTWVKERLIGSIFEGIGDIRNTVMHDKVLDLRAEWKAYADRMLDLFDIRNGLEQRYLHYV